MSSLSLRRVIHTLQTTIGPYLWLASAIKYKVLEHIVVSNMVKHHEPHGILVGCHYGYSTMTSCETQIIPLTHEISNHHHSAIQKDLIILDLSKAFHKVPHKKIICKLYNNGKRGTTLKWIGSVLSNIMQQVVLDGESSSILVVVSGVHQGSDLSIPLLFLGFINDIPTAVASQTHRFANDCIL